MPDSEDGWYLHPQITSPPLPNSNYVVIDLGEGIPHGMNNLNDVVGERIAGAEYFHEAFLFKLGQTPVWLGFLTNDASISSFQKKSIAYDINDDGVITGEATYAWDPNVSGEYPDPPSYPILITYNDGTTYSRDNHDTHAFRWENGVMTDSGDLSWSLPPTTDHPDISNKGTSLGYAINNSGTIAGTSDYDVQLGGGSWYWEIQTKGPHAASFPNGTDAVDINMSTYYSEGYAINDFGAIVGYCSGDEAIDDRAFLVDGATVEFLGSPRSGAYGIAINNFYHAIGDFGIGGYNSLYADDALHLRHSGAPAAAARRQGTDAAVENKKAAACSSPTKRRKIMSSIWTKWPLTKATMIVSPRRSTITIKSWVTATMVLCFGRTATLRSFKTSWDKTQTGRCGARRILTKAE